MRVRSPAPSQEMLALVDSVAMTRTFPALQSMISGDLERLPVVIDAEPVLGQIRYLAQRAVNPSSPTHFEENAKVGSLLPFAPQRLLVEVQKHLPRFSAELDIPLAELTAYWERLRPLIRIVRFPDIPAPPRDAWDADDWEYVHLSHALGARGVVTRNKRHVRQLGGDPLPPEALSELRSHTRAVIHRYALFIEVSVLVGLGIKAIGSLYGIVRRLPTPILLLLLIAAVGFRRDLFKSAVKALGDMGKFLVLLVVEEYEKRGDDASLLQECVHARVPPRPRFLRHYALQACLEAARPLTEKEILTKAKQLGYPHAGSLPYLRRELRRHPYLCPTRAGRWVPACFG